MKILIFVNIFLFVPIYARPGTVLKHACERKGHPKCDVVEDHLEYELRCYKPATWASVAYQGQEDKKKIKMELQLMFEALGKYLKQVKEKFKNPAMIRFPTQESEVQRKTLGYFLTNGEKVFEKPDDNNTLVITHPKRCFYVYKHGGDFLKQHRELHRLLEIAKISHSHDGYYVNTYTYRKKGKKLGFREVLIEQIEEKKNEKEDTEK